MKQRFFVLVFAAFWACTPQAEQAPAVSHIQSPAGAQRGFWLTNVASEAMFSQAGLRAVVDSCAAWGFTHIYVVTWNRGYTLYPSAVMDSLIGESIMPEFAGRDPLQELIDLAHPKGIKVIAWFEFGFADAYGEEGAHLLQGRAHWKALNSEGKHAEKNGFTWMNAFHPEVQNFLLSLILEVVDTYEVDGVQGDDRLPALPSLAGYEPYTLDLYRAAHNGQNPPEDYKDPEWVQWRADLLSDFMHRLHDSVKAHDPACIVSSAPSIYPWSKEEYLQDWPVWINNGWVDELCPQVYRYDLPKYQGEMKKIMTSQVDKAYRERVWPGVLLKVGSYVAQEDLLRQMMKTNRDYGVGGEVYFFYEGLKAYPGLWREAYKE